MRPDHTSSQVFDSLLKSIQKGRFKAGEYLPGERELAGMFDVSRPTMRRVIARLQTSGLIQARPGAGNLVVKKAELKSGIRNIAYFVPDISNPFFSHLGRELTAQFQAAGMNVAIMDYNYGIPHLLEALQQLTSFESAVIHFTGSREELRDLGARVRVPIVLMHPYRDETAATPYDQILIDSFGGAHAVVTHLLSIGRKRIAFLASPGQSAERWRGGQEAMKQALGKGARFFQLEPGLSGFHGGYEAVRRAISDKIPFDGLFGANDELALGALAALKDSGIKIPDEVAVAGFDNLLASQIIRPKLTTIRQPIQRLATLAREMLESRMAGDTGKARQVFLPAELLVRESTQAGFPEPKNPPSKKPAIY
ncbi:MAG: substrate-binding domain-containing protein [Terrimicrobiaceae bacterium]